MFKVVDINKIYNEFSSGSKDITAIRDFITKLNTPAGSLKYVFLLGDTSMISKTELLIIQTSFQVTKVSLAQM